ncbi:MAG: PH domain-containing protein [Gammaproteobacteria bacterium]|nr:PH domain-containing protein [Gammaproteobacteria bacterium]
MSVINAQFRPAWRNYWFGFVIVLLLLAAAAITAAGRIDAGGTFAAGLWLAAALVVLLIIAFKRFSWKFSIDDSRVSRHYGIISRNQQSVRIRDVRSVELDQGILQRILGVGNLAFYSAGSDNAEVRFIGIKRPLEWRDRIDQAMDRLKHTND